MSKIFTIRLEYENNYEGQKKKNIWQSYSYTIFIQYIFCFALVNAYNDYVKNSILLFSKMLKNNSLLFFVYWVLFLMLLWVLLFTTLKTKNSGFVFTYPDEEISFAGQKIPFSDNDLYNKERFDKEFLLTSNNLYQFYLYIKRYPLYIPEIEKKLLASSIPDDFKYLPIAESALRNDVVSSAGAAGIWQFMPDTARRFWLQVNQFVDERYHFEKSTNAAIEYIKFLYEQFWDWTLVAAAYNRWENGLQRALDTQKVTNYYDLYLNEETSRYVFRITAIKYVIQWYLKKQKVINTLIWWTYKKPHTVIIKVSKIDDLASWAKKNNYKYKDIKILNRWIVWDTLPEGDWDITVLQK